MISAHLLLIHSEHLHARQGQAGICGLLRANGWKPRALSLKEWDIIHFWPFEDLRLTQIPFWSVIIWKTERFSECKILFVLWTNRAIFSPYFPWQYFRVNSLHCDHFTQLEDPLQTETTKVASATSDCVDSCQVLYYKTECWHQWNHNEKEMLL